MKDERIHKTIALDYDSWELICKNEIKNVSDFINELIYEALRDKEFTLKKTMKQFNEAQQKLKEMGFEINIVKVGDSFIQGNDHETDKNKGVEV